MDCSYSLVATKTSKMHVDQSWEAGYEKRRFWFLPELWRKSCFQGLAAPSLAVILVDWELVIPPDFACPEPRLPLQKQNTVLISISNVFTTELAKANVPMFTLIFYHGEQIFGGLSSLPSLVQYLLWIALDFFPVIKEISCKVNLGFSFSQSVSFNQATFNKLHLELLLYLSC